MPQLTKDDLHEIIDTQFKAREGAALKGLSEILEERSIPAFRDSADEGNGPKNASIARIKFVVWDNLQKAVNRIEGFVDEEAFTKFLSVAEAGIWHNLMPYTFPNGVSESDVERDVKGYVSKVMKQNWEQRISPPPSYGVQSFDALPPSGAAPAVVFHPSDNSAPSYLPPSYEEDKVQADLLQKRLESAEIEYRAQIERQKKQRDIEEARRRSTEHLPQKADLLAVIDAQFKAREGAALAGLSKILEERLIPEFVDSKDEASIARIKYVVRNNLQKAVNELRIEGFVDEEAFTKFLSVAEAGIWLNLMAYTFPNGVSESDVERDVKGYVSKVMKQNWEQRISPSPVSLHFEQANQEANRTENKVDAEKQKPSPRQG
jgi:hypothetical protein